MGPIPPFSRPGYERVKAHTWNVQPDFYVSSVVEPFEWLEWRKKGERDRIKPWITSPDEPGRFLFTTYGRAKFNGLSSLKHTSVGYIALQA